MKIDLNNQEELTIENVRALIASKDDSQHRQLRVTKDGIAFISDITGAREIDDLAFRYETWGAGNDYIGEKASKDEQWVRRVFDSLKENWPRPRSSYIDIM